MSIDPQTYTSAQGLSAGIYASGFAGESRMAGAMPDLTKQASDASGFAALVKQAGNGQADGQTGSASAAAGKTAGGKASSGSFLDFLTTLFDIVNPLEHLPIISTIYEHVTGHHMNPIARIAGDTLYGGPVGAAVGVANVITEQKTGKDIGENMLAMFSGKTGGKPAGTAVAAAGTPSPTPIVWNQKINWDPQPGFSGAIFARGPSGSFDTAGGSAGNSVGADSAPFSGADPARSIAASQPAPRNLVAGQMLAGLDKYAAMRQSPEPEVNFNGTY